MPENDRLKHALDFIKAKASSGTSIYVIQCCEYSKIGIAKNIKSRISSLQIGCPYELRVIAKLGTSNARSDERRLHHLLRRFRTRGEWFKLSDSLIAHIVKAQTVADLLDDGSSKR